MRVVRLTGLTFSVEPQSSSAANAQPVSTALPNKSAFPLDSNLPSWVVFFLGVTRTVCAAAVQVRAGNTL